MVAMTADRKTSIRAASAKWRAANRDKARAAKRAWYQANKEKALAYGKKYYQENAESFKTRRVNDRAQNTIRVREKNADPAYRKRRQERRAARYHGNEETKAAVKRAERISRLKRAFGLTVAEFERLFELQGMACAICQRATTDRTRGWCIDHDHDLVVTDADRWRSVRGILCGGCNVWLGVMGDNLNRITAQNAAVIEIVTNYLTVTAAQTQARIGQMKASQP